MMKILRLTLLFVALFVPQLVNPLLAKEAAPEILLAQIYQSGIDVKAYLVSEKLDGVRAVWDGKTLRTRKGNLIYAPAWFTKNFPESPLDGELWIARGRFDAVSGAVRKDVPVEEEWRAIAYYVFELPNAKGDFQRRAAKIVHIVNKANTPYLKAVKQYRVSNEAALKQQLDKTVKMHGEGLMLHRADAQYVTGRSHDLLKLKPYFDAEATVVGYVAGRGKHAGKLGALLVETPEGIRFKLGTGFSDAEREHPPTVGSMVTYTYKDITLKGKPKFASFLRVRRE
jgi:DNA ligase-1